MVSSSRLIQYQTVGVSTLSITKPGEWCGMHALRSEVKENYSPVKHDTNSHELVSNIGQIQSLGRIRQINCRIHGSMTSGTSPSRFLRV